MIGKEISQDRNNQVIRGENGIEIQQANAWRSIHDDQLVGLLNGTEQPPQPKFSRIHRKEGKLDRREVQVGRDDIQCGEVGFDDRLLNLFPLDQGIEKGLGVLLIVKPQTLGEMALGVEIDQKGLESHLSQTKPVGGRDAALPRPPFKIEEELFPDRFDRRGESKVIPILHHILWFIIPFLFRIPFRGRKDSLSFFFNKVMLRYAEKS